jgi:signal peptidase I
MAKYEILITTILGLKGDVVELPDGEQTKERLKKGLIKRAPEHKPEETKTKRTRKVKNV